MNGLACDAKIRVFTIRCPVCDARMRSRPAIAVSSLRSAKSTLSLFSLSIYRRGCMLYLLRARRPKKSNPARRTKASAGVPVATPYRGVAHMALGNGSSATGTRMALNFFF